MSRPRERDILRCIARGASNKEIGTELGIAETTVNIHVQHVRAGGGADDKCWCELRGAINWMTLLGDSPHWGCFLECPATLPCLAALLIKPNVVKISDERYA